MFLARTFFAAALLSSTAAFAQQPPAAQPTPVLTRIKMVTIGAPDLGKIKDYYKHLDFKVLLEDKVTPELAMSWGAPKMANRPELFMASAGSPDVYIRAVQIDPVKDYKPMTTLGWNAFEIIVDDLDKVAAKVKGSPFTVVGEPKSLGGSLASIHAMQVVGPAGELLYLTTETGDRAKSSLPQAKSLIDRPFIVILASHDVGAMADFYKSNFQVGGGFRFDGPLSLASTAQGLPPETKYELGLVRLANPGNSVELDGYPKTIPMRPHANGQLPPGNAMVSFNVKSIDGLKMKWVTPPAKLYDNKLAASYVGAAGEITEIIEEQPR